MEQPRIVYVERVKPTELVIEESIIQAIYSQRQDIFRNKERFQVVLSEPSPRFTFRTVTGIYKGRFICSNNNCLQRKRNDDKTDNRRRKPSDHSNGSHDEPNHPSWLQWWKTQQSTLKPALKYEEEKPDNSIQSAKKSVKPKTANSKLTSVINHLPSNPVNSLYENTRWSSSLTYVIFNFCSRPAPLDKLLEIYNSPKKIKIQIFIYVELKGQKCQKCVNSYNEGLQSEIPQYEYPFFGRTQLKRMRKNFSSYIYNKIFGISIKKYRPCTLVQLKDHKTQLCQACNTGTCKKSLGPINSRSRRRRRS